MQKNFMITNFTLLSQPGNIGFYDRAEVSTIFLHHKESNKYINVYTLVVFEEGSIENEKHLRLKSPFKDYGLHIIQHYESLDVIKNLFETLLTKNHWSYKEKDLTISKLKLIPKQFVPCSTPLCSILKNNFYNGSHILEFFDEEKSLLDSLYKPENIHQLKRLTEEVQKHFPIDLLYIKDRLGNIIFQFPVNVVGITHKRTPNQDSAQFTIDWDKRADIRDAEIQVLSINDSLLMGYGYSAISSSTETVHTGNLGFTTKAFLVDKSNKLILHSFEGGYFSSFKENMLVGGHEPRIFTDGFGKLQKINIFSKMPDAGISERNYQSIIENRVYDQERILLEKNLTFKQYAAHKQNIDKNSLKKTALADIIRLIKEQGINGVYLWDPYLSADDILNTLYHSEISHVPLRAIGSKKASERESDCPTSAQVATADKQQGKRSDWVVKQQEKLSISENNLELNLEFRIPYNNHGWNFHDRFLIFPQEKPRIWSLGISLNQFGVEHHILQEVKNARNILDAFEQLWDELNHPECIVFESEYVK